MFLECKECHVKFWINPPADMKYQTVGSSITYPCPYCEMHQLCIVKGVSL